MPPSATGPPRGVRQNRPRLRAAAGDLRHGEAERVLAGGPGGQRGPREPVADVELALDARLGAGPHEVEVDHAGPARGRPGR